MAESRWEDDDNWHRISRAWEERGERRMAWAKAVVSSDGFAKALSQELLEVGLAAVRSHVESVIEAIEHPLELDERVRLEQELEKRTPAPPFARKANVGDPPRETSTASEDDLQDPLLNSQWRSFLPHDRDLYADMIQELERQIIGLEFGRAEQVPALSRSWDYIRKESESARQFTLLDYCESVHEALFALEAGPAESIARTINRVALSGLEASGGELDAIGAIGGNFAGAAIEEIGMDVEDDLCPYFCSRCCGVSIPFQCQCHQSCLQSGEKS